MHRKPLATWQAAVLLLTCCASPPNQTNTLPEPTREQKRPANTTKQVSPIRQVRIVAIPGAWTRAEASELNTDIVESDEFLRNLDHATELVRKFVADTGTPGKPKRLFGHITNHEVRNYDLRVLALQTTAAMDELAGAPLSTIYTGLGSIGYPRVLVVWQYTHSNAFASAPRWSGR